MAPNAVPTNAVDMNPDVGEFQFHAKSTANDLEACLVLIQPHDRHVVSYMMTDTGSMHVYETCTRDISAHEGFGNYYLLLRSWLF